MNMVSVARTSEIPDGTVRSVSAGGRAIALYRLGGRFYAMDARCTHGDVELALGRIVGALIECPLHVARFDIATGKGMGAPITRDLATYPVRVEGEDVLVGFPDGAAPSVPQG
jgi:nitrite reductase/ring-hydroxylating ferredoxin subunit